MNKDQGMDVFEKAPVGRAVLQNVLPAMAAMLMVLVYNLADTFFIGQTRDALQVAAVSLATPVFLLFMAVGSVFGMGGTSVISRAMGEGRRGYAQKVCSFCMWSCVGVGLVMAALFLLSMDHILTLVGASQDTWAYAKRYLTIVSVSGPFVLIANCYSNVIRAEGQYFPPGACLHSRHVPAGRGLSRAGTHLGPARGRRAVPAPGGGAVHAKEQENDGLTNFDSHVIMQSNFILDTYLDTATLFT